MEGSNRSHLFAVLRIASVLEGEVESQLGRVGLSLPKLAALRHLVLAGESLPLGQLAERLSCVKSNVTQLIDRLEADGLVSRAPDPNDRRSRLAVVTESGRKAYEEGIRIQRDAERELFSVLSPSEAAQLLQLVAKLEKSHV
ncbi:MAG: MarR family winged helix-turn-helix transcriptional regulator [Rudaea sp.]